MKNILEKRMICQQCERECPALYPGAVCVNCFDFDLYRLTPLPNIRTEGVDMEAERAEKRACYRARRDKLRAAGINTKGKKINSPMRG